MNAGLPLPETRAAKPTPNWPAADTAALVEAWNAGAAPAALAARFGTTVNAIYARVRALRRQGVALQARRRQGGVTPKQGRRNGPARRKCLTCGESFRSTHVGNRICLTCLESDLF
ncbi:MAG: hypothetical protein AB7P52_11465 [Alphaproteobacteria bacterium]